MVRLLFFILLITSSCQHTTYYIVRHAEKAPGTLMTSSTANATDVPLSAEGSERAQALRDALIAKNIKNIYATNTIRAMTTAKPLSEGTGVIVTTYALDSTFLKNLKILKGNTLVVGHSNTVDNIVNSFFVNPKLKDIPDSAYGDLFIIRRKGSQFTYSKTNF